MTTESAFAGDDPRRLLSGAHELARRVRRAQRATWFPLLVFAAVTFAAVPVDRYGHYAMSCHGVHSPGLATPGQAGPGLAGPGLVGKVCSVYSVAGFVYWPIALVLAYAAIAAFYLHQSRARGVGSRVRPYVIVGVIIAVLLTGAALWAAKHPPAGVQDVLGWHMAGDGLYARLASPATAIGLALLVLAWAERHPALLGFTLGYLVIVLVPVDFGWVMAHPWPWFFLPHLVIDGSVLLLGAFGFGLAQRPARQP